MNEGLLRGGLNHKRHSLIFGRGGFIVWAQKSTHMGSNGVQT
jgi:hypothetical protein